MTQSSALSGVPALAAREQVGPLGIVTDPIAENASPPPGRLRADPADQRSGTHRNLHGVRWHDRCMGNVYPSIDDSLTSWLSQQRMFFVGTAPLRGDGSVNVSPKGMAGTFAVITPSRVAYLDYTGSGAETIAHLRENGRIVLMFCAFEGPPKIVRLHGKGRVVLGGEPEFGELRPAFGKDRMLGQRSVIVVDVTRISDSCGYAVPLMEFRADRDILDRSQERRDEGYFRDYWRQRNETSIDGLRAMDAPALDC